MAISKNSDDSLSVNDILKQVGITPGTTIDFASLGTLLGAGNSNHVLPDSFVGKTLTLSAGSISVSPSGTLSFAIAGETKTITVTSNGVFLITDIPSWLSVSPIAAIGTTTVRLYASPNSDLGTNSRTATLNFLGASNISRTTKALSQNGNPVTALISGDTTISSSTTTRNIVLTLSNQLSVTSVSLTNTTGFSINTTPTISAGSTTTDYTYTLTITAADSGTSKNSTAEFFVGGAGYSTTLRSKTTQTGLSEYLDSNITVTGFDVNSLGVITAPTVSPSGGTIVYSTATNGGGTTYTLANGFPLVNSNTTRYAKYTITVPAGYSNTGASLSKSVSAIQELATTFVSSDISISGFDVNLNGTITAPTVSPAASAIVYSTATDGGGTTYTLANGFPLVTSNTTRYCKVSVTVPAGYFNAGATVSRTVSATQELIPTFTSADISITGFDVDSNGTISTATVTPTASSIVYSTETGGGGTRVVPPAKFELVGVNTTRYVTATVTVPSGYFNTGASISRTISAIQEEKFYGQDEMSIGLWSVDEFGVVSAPISVSATGVTSDNITISYDGGPSVLTKGYPQVLTQTTRTVTATVTVPSGWYNSGESQSITRNAIQPATELTGWLFFPYQSTAELYQIGGTGATYSNYAFWGSAESDTKDITFSLRTNVVVQYEVLEYSAYYSILQVVDDVPLIDNKFLTYLEVEPGGVIPTSAKSFRLRVTAPPQNQSYTTTLYFTTTDADFKNFEFTITLGRAADTGGGVEPLVTPTVKQLPIQ